jgi:hypothetical protein
LREQGYLFALTGSFFRVNREFFTLTGIGSPGANGSRFANAALIAWAIAGVGMLMLGGARHRAQPIWQRPAGGHRPHRFALDRRIAAKYDPHVSRSPAVERFAP